MISCVAPQKLRALLKPSSAAAQKMPEAMQPSSNGNAAKEQTVSQAFAVRACGASGYLSELKSIHSFKGTMRHAHSALPRSKPAVKDCSIEV